MLFQELCKDLYDELCDELFDELCYELFDEFFEEIFDELCKELSDKLCDELFDEVFDVLCCERCEEIGDKLFYEVLKSVLKMLPSADSLAQSFQDFGHRVLPYGPTLSRQITYFFGRSPINFFFHLHRHKQVALCECSKLTDAAKGISSF